MTTNGQPPQVTAPPPQNPHGGVAPFDSRDLHSAEALSKLSERPVQSLFWPPILSASAETQRAQFATDGEPAMKRDSDNSLWQRRYNGTTGSWEYVGGGSSYVSTGVTNAISAAFTARAPTEICRVFANVPTTLTSGTGWAVANFTYNTNRYVSVFFSHTFYTTTPGVCGVTLNISGLGGNIAVTQIFVNAATTHITGNSWFAMGPPGTWGASGSKTFVANLFGAGCQCDTNDLIMVQAMQFDV